MLRAVLLVFLVGCGKKASGPTCEQVVEHMLTVTKTQLMGHEGANFTQQKKAMVAQCEQRNYDAETRTCLLTTQTISDIAKCRGTKSDAFEKQRRPRTGSGSARSLPPGSWPPAGSGSGSAAGSGSATTASGSGS
ncbi:MAG: hypothetical protein H0V17_36200, partial [Deltaproteobacteria bacterium]|nr:hypothetical protein [Deltaproteobacteria bacterium]